MRRVFPEEEEGAQSVQPAVVTQVSTAVLPEDQVARICEAVLEAGRALPSDEMVGEHTTVMRLMLSELQEQTALLRQFVSSGQPSHRAQHEDGNLRRRRRSVE